MFVADGVEYNLPSATTYTTSVTAIVNAGTKDADTYTLQTILAKADSKKVTLNAKVSGVNIEAIRSAVAWDASNDAKVTTAQLEDITAKKELLGGAFAKDKTGALDTTQFNLLGASALSAIAKDNIVYIYKDAAGKIRQVAVGTSVVAGKVTSKGSDYVYVNGNKYEAATTLNGSNNLPALSDNTSLRLDYFGDVYSFTSTDTANKYGVVVAYTSESALSNAKAKIFTSDDSSTVYDFVGNDDITANTESNFLNANGLVKYRVDANGDVDTVVTVASITDTTNTTVQALSSKVLAYTVTSGGTTVTTYYGIASNVVVFTRDGSTFALSKIADVKLATQLSNATGVAFIMNSDNEVGALLVDISLTTTTTSDSYGVVNTVAQTKNSANKEVQTLSGFIGATAFADKLTDNKDDFTFASGAAYAIKIDAAGTYTQTASLLGTQVSLSGTKASGYILGGNGVTVAATNADRTVLTATSTAGPKLTISSNAVVYKLVVTATGAFDYYEIGKLTDIGVDDKVWAYDTKGKDVDNVANMVIYQDL